MAVNPKAKKVTLFFEGGSVTAPRGLWEEMFAGDLGTLGLTGDPKTVARDGHTRTRVIGGPSTAVSSSNYQLRRVKRGKRGGAAGGEAVKILWEGDLWTARLFGSHQDFESFWKSVSFPLNGDVSWVSEKGTPYGPYNK